MNMEDPGERISCMETKREKSTIANGRNSQIFVSYVERQQKNVVSKSVHQMWDVLCRLHIWCRIFDLRKHYIQWKVKYLWNSGIAKKLLFRYTMYRKSHSDRNEKWKLYDMQEDLKQWLVYH